MEVDDDEEEDGALLSSLGVTSANPEDIERHVLADVEARSNGGKDDDSGAPDGSVSENSKRVDSRTTSRAKLYNKLRAVEFEIDAVASTVEQVRNVGRNDGEASDDSRSEKAGADTYGFLGDSTLQHALASDRLRSLEQAKAELEKELSELHAEDGQNGINSDKLLRSIVKEKPIQKKKKSKDEGNSNKNLKKRQRVVSFHDDADFDNLLDAASSGLIETERDQMVRKGLLTPFHKLKGFERRIQETEASKESRASEDGAGSSSLTSDSLDRVIRSMSEAAQSRPMTMLLDPKLLPKLEAPTSQFQRLKAPMKNSRPHEAEEGKVQEHGKKHHRPLPGRRWRKRVSLEDVNLHDDGDEAASSTDGEEQEEAENVDDSAPPYTVLEGGLKIPDSIFSKLFDYQKVGVQWMWELHCQRAGGIIGDEMGLGKTIQVLSFLAALHFSKMYKPSIVVCPVTLLRQWKREARKWCPKFHAEILHDSADDNHVKKRDGSSDSEIESEGSLDSDYEANPRSRNAKKWDPLIKRVLKSESGLLITTYEQLRLLAEKLLDIEWGYAILDEGHRIRNPNAEITLVCKQLQTVHRIIMTGAPIQNKLSELWSLFDFVFPGKLGVLPVFEAEFAVPITVGGYANASPLQVSTAYRCAVVLRDLVMPYLLRRMKDDVNAQLTKKTEHVLFCSLTAEQRSVYRAFLASSEVEQILDGSRNSLYGIDVMRKICNHPDLLEREHSYQNPDYGNPVRSGKMKVVAEVLKVWKEQGHRVLLFAQTQQMLDILENFLIAREYNYRRMDGLTPVKQRMALIDEFNDSSDVFIFILTTKVGGLGTNLTGANRVIIFDPDWNPSTDMQARERAWRIGQTKDVTVYRLITRGTIEEKVYHRQIYKHFLTNKILKNPQQRRFFRARDMKDLFTLNDNEGSGSTETYNIFSQLPEDASVVGTQTSALDNNRARTSGSSDSHDPDTGPSKSVGKEVPDPSREEDGETDILRSLLDAHGIHSAMNHDVIMNAHHDEKMRLEEEASKVAQRAAEALRQSRMLRSRESVAVPTWTGKSGVAGAPSNARQKFGSTVSSRLVNSNHGKPDDLSSNGNRNGIAAGVSAGRALSSSELIARIKGTQESAAGAAVESHLGSTSVSAGSGRSEAGPSRSSHGASHIQPEILIRQICTFLQQRDGRTDSATIVQHFKERIPSKDLPLFKSLLKEIATLTKDPNGSLWVLKPEYQ
ncbi:hypothetical protein MLD38_020227 [Melastoma candidum]|uniref:Uncharacterized protein n=1 Tax=Melastoma candidum TaxID=119954 RepID=A0ACB9QCG0_9MYRT|nr:hypothetical protein MLD38_020227 [Melastoma candidum]